MLEFEETPESSSKKKKAKADLTAGGNSADGADPSMAEQSRSVTTTATLPRVMVQHETIIPGRIRLLKALPKILLFLGAITSFYGYRHKGAISELSLSPAVLSDDPTQLEMEDDPFPLHYRGKTYVVEPVADYEFAGLVVTRNNISAIDDIYHTADSVDVVDICVVWGENLNSTLLGKFRFWSEPWSCNYQTDSREAASQFTGRQLSNNHLLPANESIGAQLASIRIGDQVRVRGKLVNYYAEGHEEQRRKSSTSRTDVGNGACEVVYVEGVSILSRGTPLAYRLWGFGFTLILTGILFSLVNFFVIPLSYYRNSPGRS